MKNKKRLAHSCCTCVMRFEKCKEGGEPASSSELVGVLSRSFCWLDASSVTMGCLGTRPSAGSVHSGVVTRPGRWREPMPHSAVNCFRYPMLACVIVTEGVKRVMHQSEWFRRSSGVGDRSLRRRFCRTNLSNTDFPNVSQLKMQNVGIKQNVVTGLK